MPNTQLTEYKHLEQSLGQKLFSKQELERLDKGSLDNYVKDLATSLVEKIGVLQEKVEEAERLTRRAENSEVKSDWKNRLSIGFFGKSAADKAHDRVNLLAQAQKQQNEALLEMNTLIQESIKFTCLSFAFANRMVEYLGEFLNQGFMDKDGHIQRLTDKQKEQMGMVLTQAQNFVDRERKIEGRFGEIHERLDEKDDLDEQQSQAIAQNRQDIESIQYKMGEKRQALDSIQQELGKKRERLDSIDERLEHKKAIDEIQEQKIIALQEQLAELAKKTSTFPMALSSLALVLAIVAIVLQLAL